MGDINNTDIKLMQSQKLDDTEEGGGMMTSIEVVDGSINNLFPDISRLDRTYGRVSLRKGFPSVHTTDRSTYYGAHVAITEQVADPLVSMTFFTTDNWFDMRQEAVNRIQSYLAVGPQFMAALFGNHYKGSKMLVMFAELTTKAPVSGAVLALTKDGVNYEYIRILSVESVQIEGITANGTAYKKNEFTIEIGNSLENDYTGAEPSIASSYINMSTKINRTVVADAAKYYGVAKLADPIVAGSLNLRVNTIYQNIVPSAKSTTPITDFGVGANVTPLLKLANASLSRSVNLSFFPNAQVNIGDSIYPGSLAYGTYKDDEKGNFIDASNNTIGAINYSTGVISLGSSAPTVNATGILSYYRAATQAQTANTGMMYIRVYNRGYNYVYNCYPNPAPKSLKVEFLAGGTWYTLEDIGGGQLKGVGEDLGSGTVNYTTGTVSLSLKYLPDIDSCLVFFWGRAFSTIMLTPTSIPYTFKKTFTGSSGEPINIGKSTFRLTWTQNNVVNTITDNGIGELFHGATKVGTIKYSGEVEFRPTVTPLKGTPFQITYAESAPYIYESDFLTGKLPHSSITPLSVNFKLRLARIIYSTRSISPTDLTTSMDFTGESQTGISGFGRYVLSRLVNVSDDGIGNLKINKDNTTIGTINYTTGEYTIDPESITIDIRYYIIGSANVALQTKNVNP